MSDQSSNTLNYLKCILCVGVVFIHSLYFPDVVTAIGGGYLSDYQCFMTFDKVFRQDFLNSTCVPLFFCISGYLFFCNCVSGFDIKLFYKKIKTRVRSLAIPYLIANLMMISAVIAIDLLHGNNPSFVSAISSFWAYNGTSMPIDGPTWYIRDLMIVCLFAPIIYSILRHTDFLLVGILLVCWFLGLWPFDLPGFGIRSFLFFSIGAYLSMKEIDIIRLLNTRKYWWVYFSSFIIIFGLYQYFEYSWLLKLSILASFPVWIALADFVCRKIKKACPKTLITGTFFIFLYHCSLAHRVPVLLTKLFGISEFSVFISYIIGGVLTTVFLFCIYLLLKKFVPKLAGVVVGGR